MYGVRNGLKIRTQKAFNLIFMFKALVNETARQKTELKLNADDYNYDLDLHLLIAVKSNYKKSELKSGKSRKRAKNQDFG